MKNATVYAKKLKTLLSALKKRFSVPTLPADLTHLDHLVLSVLRTGTTYDLAMEGLRTLREEFVDFNEMRVAPPKDIADNWGSDMPQARVKAELLTLSLNRVFDHGKELGFNYLADFGKRELKAHLRENIGLPSYSEAYLTLYVFGGHAVPVDENMVQKLKAEDMVHQDADVEEVRALLERTVTAKEARETYELLAEYAAQEEKSKAAKRKLAGKTRHDAGDEDDSDDEDDSPRPAVKSSPEPKPKKPVKKPEKPSKHTR